MIDIVHSQTEMAATLRDSASPLVEMMAELIYTDTPTTETKYYRFSRLVLFRTKGMSNEEFELNRVSFVDQQREKARSIAFDGLDPQYGPPVTLGMKHGDMQVIDGNRRLAVLLAVGRPAMSADPVNTFH